MKRIFSLLFVAVICSAAAFAQTDLVATLKHGSTISEYYGISALVDAYAAAEEGDVITLSSGAFTAVNIGKAITIRGAGVKLANENPTLLLGGFTINIPANTSSLTLEGIVTMDGVSVKGTAKMESCNILKCYFGSYVECRSSNPTFIHCVFSGNLNSLYTSTVYGNTYVKCLECAINSASAQGRSGNYIAKMDLVNCIVNPYSGLEHSTFQNCIIKGTNFNFNTDHYITNCLCMGVSGVPTDTNTITANNISTYFKTFTGEFSVNETFELTDEGKKYLGADGTQVGIYGGTNPFDPTPTNPQVKKFAVTTNTVNDKLNVNINVE